MKRGRGCSPSLPGWCGPLTTQRKVIHAGKLGLIERAQLVPGYNVIETGDHWHKSLEHPFLEYDLMVDHI